MAVGNVLRSGKGSGVGVNTYLNLVKCGVDLRSAPLFLGLGLDVVCFGAANGRAGDFTLQN
jgi:hypothetical protein